MIEIEAKIRVEDLAAVRARLNAHGGYFIGRYEETNHILDRADGALCHAGCGLRVRAMATLEGREAPATVTFKGPIQSSVVKRREEIELNIADTGSMLSLLSAIGFRTVVSFRKRRERWDLKECHVELDEVPFLGRFVEVEGACEEAVRAVQGLIGLADEPHVPSGYARMLLDWCRETGRPAIGIGFEDA